MILTLAVTLAVVGLAVARRGGVRPPPVTAEQALTQLLQAAERGDTKAYIAGLGSPLRESLQAAAAEAGPAAFSAALRRRPQEMTGWAVTRLSDGDDPVVARLRVEAVFRDRNETQDYELRRAGRGWRVVSVSAAMVTRMPVAYGTAVGAESAASGSNAGGGTPR